MRMQPKFLSIYLFLLPLISFSQDSSILPYARQIIDTLAAPGMHGRGYVSGGDSIAAKYIADRFAEYGLKNFGKIGELMMKRDYYQRFSFSVNTFPGIVSLSINRKKLIPGKDFIIDARSFSCKGKCRILKVWNKENKKATLMMKPRPLMVDTTGLDKAWDELIFAHYRARKNMPIVFVEKKKLTADVSRFTNGFSVFTVLESALPKRTRRIKYEIKQEVVKDHKTQNVIGYVQGTQFPDSFIVYTAHYDHLGRMGKDTYFPGANDNASGCAMLLSLAKHYAKNPAKYSIAFIAFAGEEAGLIGSKYFVEHPLIPLKKIKFLVNFDILGTGDEGIKVVNGSVFNDEFKMLVKLNAQSGYVKEVQPRGKAPISDHYFFTENGVRSFYIYTLGGIKAYHDIYDRPETLPLTEFEDIYTLLIEFNDWLMAPK
jgi:aminopeptidase YwaD